MIEPVSEANLAARYRSLGNNRFWFIAEISLKSNGKSVECSRLAAAINLRVYDFNNLFATLIGRKGCPYS